MDEKNLHKRALDEEEKKGKKCIESASTHNEAKTILCQTNFMTQPLSAKKQGKYFLQCAHPHYCTYMD